MNGSIAPPRIEHDIECERSLNFESKPQLRMVLQVFADRQIVDDPKSPTRFREGPLLQSAGRVKAINLLRVD